jgi:hypothetical protein
MTTPVPDSLLREPSQGRYLFIDLYRSFVILLMLEGHLFRSLLPSSVQQSDAFQLHEFIHGLTAPAFLFGAGLTFVISTRKRWLSYHHWGQPLILRIRRFLLVIMLGCALHLPYFSLQKILNQGTPADIFQMFQFDVLHTIGIGLLSLHALIAFFRTESRFYGLVLTTIIAVCFLTPLVWDIDLIRLLPVPLAQMFNGNHGSPFPLFPYVGFLYVGVIVSWEFLVAVEQKRVQQFMSTVFFLGAVAVFLGVMLDLLPVQVYPTYNYWYTSPNYFLVRGGALMMLAAIFWFISRRWKTVGPGWTVLGRESLFVYVVHLVVLYGSVINPAFNLQAVLGGRMPLPGVAGLFLLFVTSMILCASGWSKLKRDHPRWYRAVQILGGVIFLSVFLIRKF